MEIQKYLKDYCKENYLPFLDNIRILQKFNLNDLILIHSKNYEDLINEIDNKYDNSIDINDNNEEYYDEYY